jgi:CRP/FNR family transcriptional regulator
MQTSKLLSNQSSLTPFLDGATMVGGSPIERTYAKNQPIYMMGDPAESLYVIVSGRVKVSLLSNEGREKILHLLGEGEVFGELSLIRHERSEMAIACEPTTVKVISAAQIRARIERDGQFALRCLQFLCQRLARLQEEVESQAFDLVKHRLTKTLLGLAEKFGIRNNGNVQIVGVTHETLAQLLGVYRETVSHWMPSLRAEHLISYRHGRISVRAELLQHRAPAGRPVMDQHVAGKTSVGLDGTQWRLACHKS